MTGSVISHNLLCVHFEQNTLSPLYVASQEGHTDIVDILLNAGADVNEPHTKV